MNENSNSKRRHPHYKTKEACAQSTCCRMGSGRYGGLNFKLSVKGGSEGSVFLKEEL